MGGERTSSASVRARIGIVVAAAVAASVALASPELSGIGLPEAAAAKSGTCPKAKLPAGEVPRKALRRAVACRVNRLRRKRGRDTVRRQKTLQRVAQRHTKKMVRTECLAHRCPGEPPLKRRIRRSGYLDGARRWRFVQSTGCAADAASMVRAWRKSRFHRRNMLGKRLEQIGVGTVPRPAAERCGEETATFTALLAWRVP